MFRFVLFYAAFACGSLGAQTNAPLTADQIMQQVGANQDRSDALRRTYVYRQRVRVTSHKSNGSTKALGLNESQDPAWKLMV